MPVLAVYYRQLCILFIIAEQKNHSKEQPLIERLQEIRDGKYPVEKTHSPTGKTYSPTGE